MKSAEERAASIEPAMEASSSQPSSQVPPPVRRQTPTPQVPVWPDTPLTAVTCPTMSK